MPLLNTFAVFAIAFAARPVGAVVMGAYADRFGRRSALMVTIFLMGAGSLLIALIPSYATAGPLAPALLVAARLIQGFSLGGEYGAAVTFLVESGGSRRGAFFGSFQYVASSAGHILAGLSTLAAVQLSGVGMDRWGWRLPFLWGRRAVPGWTGHPPLGRGDLPARTGGRRRTGALGPLRGPAPPPLESGTLRLTVGETVTELGAGDSACFPADTVHGYANPGGTSCVYYVAALIMRPRGRSASQRLTRDLGRE